MRIFLLDDFKVDSLRRYLTFPHRLMKGMVRCGHDVFPFSYPDIPRHQMPWRSRMGGMEAVHAATDRMMAEQIRNYRPELIVYRACRAYHEPTIRALREAAPGCMLVCWYIDLTSHVSPSILSLARHADWFISTAGGANLTRYHQAGVRRCAYMPYPGDPDLEKPYPVEDAWKSQVLFTGTSRHGKLQEQERLRSEVIERLRHKNILTIWGDKGQKKVYGMDYLYAISGCKIALSINVYNEVRFYHSNRLINSLGCGAFVLAKGVPDSEILFQDGMHLRYFDTVEQCLELAEYYLSHDRERQKIARQGMERAHEQFNCRQIAADMFTLLTAGFYDKPWSEIVQ